MLYWVFVCLLRKKLKVGLLGRERIWEDMGEGKNTIKVYLYLKIAKIIKI